MVRAFNFGKNDFELRVGGDGQDTPRNFEVSFGSIRAILPLCGLGAKTGEKLESELKVIELSYCHHSICLLKNKHWHKNIKLGITWSFFVQF